jgi:hypothetical protein
MTLFWCGDKVATNNHSKVLKSRFSKLQKTQRYKKPSRRKNKAVETYPGTSQRIIMRLVMSTRARRIHQGDLAVNKNILREMRRVMRWGETKRDSGYMLGIDDTCS